MGLVSPYKMNSGHNKYNKTVTLLQCNNVTMLQCNLLRPNLLYTAQ